MRSAMAVSLVAVAIVLVAYQLWPSRTARQAPMPAPTRVAVTPLNFIEPPSSLVDTQGKPTVPIPPRARLEDRFGEGARDTASASIRALRVNDTSMAEVQKFYADELSKRGFTEEVGLPEFMQEFGNRFYNFTPSALRDRIASAIRTRMWLGPDNVEATLTCLLTGSVQTRFLDDETLTTWPLDRKVPELSVMFSYRTLKAGEVPERREALRALLKLAQVVHGPKQKVKKSEFLAELSSETEAFRAAREAGRQSDAARRLGALMAIVLGRGPDVAANESPTPLEIGIAENLHTCIEKQAKGVLNSEEAWKQFGQGVEDKSPR